MCIIRDNWHTWLGFSQESKRTLPVPNGEPCDCGFTVMKHEPCDCELCSNNIKEENAVTPVL